jgi:hypothetical protein
MPGLAPRSGGASRGPGLYTTPSECTMESNQTPASTVSTPPVTVAQRCADLCALGPAVEESNVGSSALCVTCPCPWSAWGKGLSDCCSEITLAWGPFVVRRMRLARPGVGDGFAVVVERHRKCGRPTFTFLYVTTLRGGTGCRATARGSPAN